MRQPSRPLPAAAPGGWPLLGHAGALLRDPLGFLERAYALGDVVALRLGPNPAYVVNGPRLLRQILTADAARYDKGFQFDYLRALIGDGVGTSSGAKHRRQRRLLRPAFDHGHIDEYVGIMARCATQAADSWGAAGRIDAGHEMRLLAMTATARTMFERPQDSAADTAAVREVLAWLPVLLSGVGRRAMLPLAVLNKTPTPGNLRFDRSAAALHAMADRMVADHRAREGSGGGSGQSLLETVLNAVDEDGTGMTDAQAHDEIMTILLAGTETSAGTLSWALHVLSQDPELQRAVQQEVDEVLGAREPGAGDLSSLRLVRRVLSEVLRMYPAGWILGRRPLEDVEIGGVPVRAGRQVLLNFYGLHRDARVYPEPGRFDPDRWRDPDPAVMHSHYFPFGLGPHACLGEGFAWSLMMTTIATVASRYTVSPVPGSVVRPVARTTLHPGVVPLVLEPR